MAAFILGRQLRRTLVTISPTSTLLHGYSTPQHPHLPSKPMPLPRHHSTFRPKYSGSGRNPLEALRTFERNFKRKDQERKLEREKRTKAGLDTADLDADDAYYSMRVVPLIEKLKIQVQRYVENNLNSREELKDSDGETDEDEYDDFSVRKKRAEMVRKKADRYNELVENFVNADTAGAAYKWMKKVDQFEEKHLGLRPEYQVIDDLMNRLKVATGKEKFLLQHKLNRAIRLLEYKEKFDPNNPANFGVIPNPEQADDHLEFDEVETEKQTKDEDDDDDDEFDDMKERDDILLEKLSAIDKKLEEKLADLDHTFGRKGKLLEQEIRDLAEERNYLTEKKRKPLYRKGFDVKLINVNRTCKVTKGGQLIMYTAMLACGNYHGVIGFAKAKGSAVDIAVQKAHVKCFQNLHTVERHEEHTIAHAVQTSYKKTKLYLWPARTETGMKAGGIVETILGLAGFKNIKSKIIGSRNPHNTVRALFKALHAVETPKDVQEKLGRTVVQSYLL